MLNQGSKIAAAVDRGHYTQLCDPHNDHRGLDAINLSAVNSTVNAMLSNACGDHQAVTDFLAAAAQSSGLHDGARAIRRSRRG
ncbi:hypothetical protein [Mycobacterium camsae]|uniref:hypothetical protein n=1 Tax=Mycobacterium gordonae TaxID=1778 RepID=UPI003D662FB0